MKISILTANLASNALGRAYLLGRVLQRRYTVEILGPVFGKEIWPPCDIGDFEYKAVPGCNFPGFLGAMQKLVAQSDGDIIYAVKPRLTSFGVGLLAKKRYGRPLILDIDDWDYEGQYTSSKIRKFLGRIAHLPDPYAQQYLWLMQKFIPRADAITVVSDLLQSQFGGIIVPHGKDTNYLDPANYSGAELRKTWGLSTETIVMFLGTPRPHKGLEDLIAAIELLNDTSIILIIVGVDFNAPYTEELRKRTSPCVRLVGCQPFSKIPYFLSAADIVVLPQRDIPFAQAQVPAKVFDAMAMAKPIIATRVGDLPKILENCGIVIPSGDITILSEAIKDLASNPIKSKELGLQARQKCIEKYGWDVMEDKLEKCINSIV